VPANAGGRCLGFQEPVYVSLNRADEGLTAEICSAGAVVVAGAGAALALAEGRAAQRTYGRQFTHQLEVSAAVIAAVPCGACNLRAVLHACCS
jgi:hypothetical protein